MRSKKPLYQTTVNNVSTFLIAFAGIKIIINYWPERTENYEQKRTFNTRLLLSNC